MCTDRLAEDLHKNCSFHSYQGKIMKDVPRSAMEVRLEKASQNKARDPEKLKHQQDYYQKLSSKGVAQKKSYDVKPISMI